MKNKSIANEEIWVDIEGYQGRYQVSNHGRVKHTESNRIKVNSLNTKSQRLMVRLWCINEHRNKTHYVHKLVAEHFIQAPGHTNIKFKTKNKYNLNANNLYIANHK